MKVLLREGPVLVVLGEARHGFRGFDARREGDVRALAAAAGFDGMVRSAEQVHGTRILGPSDTGCGDAFLVGPGEAALVRHADCWPVVVCDPRRARAVVAHCGWRGAAGHLAAAAVDTLLAEGSARSDLHAVVGPGIGPSSFETGEEVASRFPADVRSRSSWGTLSVDLGAFLRRELADSGVLPHRIRMDPRDSFTDPELHSHRRDRAHAGRMACLCLVQRFVSFPTSSPFPPKEAP